MLHYNTVHMMDTVRSTTIRLALQMISYCSYQFNHKQNRPTIEYEDNNLKLKFCGINFVYSNFSCGLK